MAALVTVIAGRYSSTYRVPAGAALDLGVTNDPGYKLSYTPDGENVQGTDAYGSNVIDQIQLGLSQVSLDFITKEWKASPLNAINPWNGGLAATGAYDFTSGLVGRRATDLAGQVVMSSTANTPAASSPISMTFPYAMLHEGVPVELIFGPRHRTIPIRFRIIAYAGSSAGIAYYYSAT